MLRLAHARRVKRRLAAGERAALVASLENEAFDAQRLYAAAVEIYAPVAGRLSLDDRSELIRLFGEAAVTDLVPPGAGGLPGVRLAQDPWCGVVAVRETEESGRAEVTVRMEARARIWVGPLGYWPARLLSGVTALVFGGMTLARSQALDTYLTFALRPEADEWQVTAIEPGESGRHHLDSDPEGERERGQRLRDEAVLALAAEGAGAIAIPVEMSAALPRDPRAALSELETLDDRFGQDVIEACLRRILENYALASEGQADTLGAVANARAAAFLLRRRGWALRGPELVDVRVLAVRADRAPPELSVAVKVEAWYGPRADLDSDPRFVGYGRRRSAETFWWQLAGGGRPEQPWLLVGAELNRFRLKARARLP